MKTQKLKNLLITGKLKDKRESWGRVSPSICFSLDFPLILFPLSFQVQKKKTNLLRFSSLGLPMACQKNFDLQDVGLCCSFFVVVVGCSCFCCFSHLFSETCILRNQIQWKMKKLQIIISSIAFNNWSLQFLFSCFWWLFKVVL